LSIDNKISPLPIRRYSTFA